MLQIDHTIGNQLLTCVKNRSISGGFGTVAGSVIAALIIGLINSLVFFAGTPSHWQNLVQGLAILAALMVGVLVSRRGRA